MSEDTRKQLEHQLAIRLGREHCILTGRGASAIHIALQALSLKPGKVAVPATACISPATVPLFSGHQPIFCDISLKDFNMCPTSLRQVLTDHPDTVAIMPVHLFGQAAPMDEIVELSNKYNIPVIEDAAQALGGTLRGKPLGAWGDASVISFGHTKTLDVGWGGAVLTDDKTIATRLRLEESLLPKKPLNIDKLFSEWRHAYYSLASLAEINSAFNAFFVPLPDIFKDMYLFSFENDKAYSILEALHELDQRVSKRQHNARLYRKLLQHPALHHPVLDEQAAPWRYSILVPKQLQKAITQALRQADIDASNWYPPLYRWYASGREQSPDFFPNANRLGSEVINLWVTPGLTEGRIEQTAEIIHTILSQHPHGW